MPDAITDEGVARLRQRIGIARPHTNPPHYLSPNEDAFRHVAEAYGDDNPLWCDPSYGAGTRWAGPLAPPHLVGGFLAFSRGSSRGGWAPPRPGMRVARRNALVGVHDKVGEFAGRTVHEWSAEVFAAADGPVLSGEHRLMIRAEREKATERKKNDEVEIRPYTEEQIAAIGETVAGERSRRRGAEPRWWEDVNEGDELPALVKGPM